jgi:glycine oxidase
MLAPQVEARAGDPLLPLALAGREHYRTLVRELEQDGRTSIGYHPTGIALVALDDVQVAELRAQVEAQCAMGLAAEWWDAAELKRRVPAIGPAVLGAQFAPDDGYLDNVALVGALLAQARSRGVALRREAALEIVLAGRRVAGVRTANALYQASAVVIAAGAWSPQLAGLPRPLPVEPVRGQIILVEAPPGWSGPVLFRHGGYIVPRGGDALLGSTMERVGFDAGTTEDGLRTIREATAAILPDLRDRPVRRTWAGLRRFASAG